ncbi:AIG2-like protein D isoform X4 [Zingiber officinale]|uniref:AIG2-like protein D isoform X4 n=1 Tax=Zingiber officinale TaxID=94328 RepID=UPI001C4D4B4E|nr:AIG2-like protein D isoform X4 [Zingiber officinale]
MDDEVVQALLKHVPPSSSAVLNHYHRYSIKGRVYPAILPVETKKVTGKVLFGITNVELDVLDAFEDIEYERRVVEVSLLDKTEKLLVNAYVWSDKNDPNLYSEWDFEAVATLPCHTGRCVTRCVEKLVSTNSLQEQQQVGRDLHAWRLHKCVI